MDDVTEAEGLLEFLYAAPVGLVQIDMSGDIAMINPHAMKHLLPLAQGRDPGNLFAMLDRCAPELRNMLEAFEPSRGSVCDGHRIMVDLAPPTDGADPKVLACTVVKLDAERAIACLSDVTLQVAQERRLKQAETWFASLLNDVNDYAVLSVTADGLIDAANASWTKQSGYSCDAAVGRSMADLFDRTAGAGAIAVCEQLRLAARDGWHLAEDWHERLDGSRYWCQRLLAARTAPEGDLTGYTLVLRDVRRDSQDAHDLRRLLTEDHLTGAANRARFQHVLDRELKTWRETGAPLSLLMIDLDHFKQVNDDYGHLAGDAVLRGFAETVAAAIRPTDLLARLGGEEFAVLLPATPLEEARSIANELRTLIEDMRTVSGPHRIAVTASFGCAVASGQDVLARADEALYVAKRSGRNCVQAARPAAIAA
ncbi:GGDEF domain-containing protein [Sphingomonas oligophenolica]|uniref:diguanylate cyclase n=1 Tax=Sphingomonas oligophenolica TaxID=301154 RepID=A0A502CPA5_9SPHN|nr:sensor domain-containing diguanylate cyclase [Sphingomonas oligophenolica]TPG13626.1 diguanylate cyclase [Sphingomonas oligophenolica]